MGGGLLQLQAYGTENIYLSGNPQMTFFKMVYRRFTHFATQPIEVNFESFDQLSFTTPTRIKLRIPRNADLISKLFLNINIPAIYASSSKLFRWIPYLGSQMIQSIRMTIGSSVIEEYTGEYINLWHEMTCSDESLKTYYDMIGHTSTFNNPKDAWGDYPTVDTSATYVDGSFNYLNKNWNVKPSIPNKRLSIPIPFWCHRHDGLALPLIALQYHETIVEVTFRPINELYQVTQDQPYSLAESYELNSGGIVLEPSKNYIRKYWTKPMGNNDDLKNFTNLISNAWAMDPKLEITYIFLGDEERTYFAQNAHKYLIEKVLFYQVFGVKNRNTFEVELFHPAKEIFILPRRDTQRSNNDWSNYTHLDSDSMDAYAYQTYYLQYAQSLGGNLINNLGRFRTLPDRDLDVSLNEYAIAAVDTYTTTDIVNFVDTWNMRDISCIPIITSANWTYYSPDIIQNMQILLNGNAYIDPKRASYFSQNQPYLYHTNNRHPGVLLYSFGLEPEKYQPSGVCNFSQIKKIEFVMDMKEPTLYESPSCPQFYNMAYDINFYVVTHNVLQILGGMGSLMFAN